MESESTVDVLALKVLFGVDVSPATYSLALEWEGRAPHTWECHQIFHMETISHIGLP